MNDQENRYARQQQVPQLSGDAQQKIADAHVLVVGLGGLGSPLSLFLAGAGVGTLSLVDSDVVSLSNLHRQVLYQEADVGQAKATIAKQRLEMLNSDITINAYAQPLSIDNAQPFINAATVVVDAADNFLVSYLLSDLCFKHRIPLVSASVLATHGYLGVFCGTTNKPAPSLRAAFASPSAATANCSTAGVTGPSVGVISSLQAQEVLKVIVNDDSQLLGKLLYLDLWNYSQSFIDFSDAPEPSQQASWLAIDKLTEQNILLDVRTTQENKDNPIARSDTHIPLAEIPQRSDELDKNAHIVCVCKSGQRALIAAKLLLDSGFTNVAVTSR